MIRSSGKMDWPLEMGNIRCMYLIYLRTTMHCKRTEENQSGLNYRNGRLVCIFTMSLKFAFIPNMNEMTHTKTRSLGEGGGALTNRTYCV